MERIPRGIYTQEFRAQAVRLHEVDGLTMPEVARRLPLPGGTLKNWVYAARRGKLGEVVHAPPEKTHRHGRRALAAQTTAETETRLVVSLRLTGATTRFTWVVGSVEDATALTFAGARLRSQININLQQ